MQSLDELPRTISAAVHELKGPLQVLSMTLHGLEQRASRREPPEPSSIERADRQVRRATRLLEDLGDAGRMASNRLDLAREPCDLRAAVDEILPDVPPVRRRDVEVRGPGPVVALADPGRVTRILAGLFDRASRWSREGSPILVEVATEEAAHQGGRHRWAVVRISHHGGVLDGQEKAMLRSSRAPAARQDRPIWQNVSIPLMARIVDAMGGSLVMDPPVPSPGSPEITTLRLPVAPATKGAPKQQGSV